MSDREKAINILKTLPEDISLKEILETLNLMFEINGRIDDLNIDETATTEELLKEIEKWQLNSQNMRLTI